MFLDKTYTSKGVLCVTLTTEKSRDGAITGGELRSGWCLINFEGASVEELDWLCKR